MRFGHHIGIVSARKPTITNTGASQNPGTNPSPPPPSSGVFGGGTGEWFEDFKADFVLGTGFSNTSTSTDNSKRMSHHWGDTSKTEHRPNWTDSSTGTGGSIFMNGTSAGVGLQGEADFNFDPNNKWKGYGNGLFEFRCKMFSSTGNTGDGSGPAIVLWPGSNIWPGPEIDIGEIDPNGDIYFATHFDGKQFGWCLDRFNGDCYDPFYPKDASWWNLPRAFYNDWHVYACFLQTDRMTYYLDGKVVAVNARNYGRDYANGGENHTLGIMNRSSGTTMECDWVRWTPEATMLQKLAGTTSGTGTSTPPATTGNAASLDLAGPGGGTPGTFQIQFQGQSNAEIWYDYEGNSTLNKFASILHDLTGTTDAQVPIKGAYNHFDGNGGSFVGGTGTYRLDNNDTVWLDAVDHDWSNPSTWTNNQAMTDFLNWARNQSDSVPAGRPIALVRMHNEQDSERTMSQELSVYEAASREFISRWRAAIGRGVSLTPVFIVPVPYGKAQIPITGAMRDAWRRMCADPALNCYMGTSNTTDVATNSAAVGDYSHWDQEGATRVGRRMAIRIAKWMWANGYSNRDLSSLPTLGPRFVSCSRVAGQSNKVDVQVQHDGGTDFTVPGNTPLARFWVTDNGAGQNPTAAARQDATTLRLTLGTPLSANGAITVDYAYELTPHDEYSNPGGAIYDNRHTLAWPVSNAELSAARMNFQRTRTPVTEGAVTTAPGGTATAPPPASGTRSITINPKTPPSNSTGDYSGTLTVTGISRVVVAVQNDGSANPPWGFASTKEYAVPANGSVPFTCKFAQGQFLQVYDASDPTFQSYGDSFFFS